ncbi:MAG: hypothetical protein ACM31E_02780, partial [Fibrobacterota bacterium]
VVTLKFSRGDDIFKKTVIVTDFMSHNVSLCLNGKYTHSNYICCEPEPKEFCDELRRCAGTELYKER